MSDNDGVVNPKGLLTAAIGPVFLAFIPVTTYITKENGIVQKLVETLVSAIPGATMSRAIPALGAFYVFVTFAASGAASAGGQAASRKEGLDNNNPRQFVNNLTGLPLRLRSAHYNLMEMFPSWAIAAALTQVMAPNNKQLINLLGLHVILKTLVFYPSYLLNIAPTRSAAHLFSTASVINVCWQLAKGAM